MNWEDTTVKSDAFSLNSYAECLDKIKDLNYIPIKIKDTKGQLPEKAILLRHDIEYSIDCALAMASVEHTYEISSSYFVLMHSVFYNPFTVENTRKLMDLLDMGHEIGLHYETYYYEDLGKDVYEGIVSDTDYLSKILGIPIKSISQHRPARSSVIDQLNNCFIDAYHPSLIYDMYYISDSGCKWRNHSLYNSLGTVNHIHALIHPDYWYFEEHMNLPVIYRTIADRNARKIIDEADLLIKQNYDYLLNRSKMDEERKNRYKNVST